jgi:hypothetical protein
MNLADKLFLWLAGERVTPERIRQALQVRADEAEIEALAWAKRLQHRERDLARFDHLGPELKRDEPKEEAPA